MLPIATKIAAQTLVKSKTRQASSSYQKSSPLFKRILWGSFGAIAVFFVGRFVIRRIRRNKTLKQLAYKPEVQQAALIRGALNPSGSSWLMWGDGTKEENLYSTASQIKDINIVAQAYQNLYNSNMLLDIQNELNANEYTQFLNTINKQNGYSNNSVGVENTDQNKFVVITNNQADVYSSLRSFNLPFQSIKVLHNSEFPVGKTTGKKFKLSLFGSSFTQQYTAIEVNVRVGKGGKDGRRNIYIDANKVKLINTNKEAWKGQYKPILFEHADF